LGIIRSRQQQINRLGVRGRDLQRLRPVGSFDDVESLLLENTPDETTDCFIVIHQQYRGGISDGCHGVVPTRMRPQPSDNKSHPRKSVNMNKPGPHFYGEVRQVNKYREVSTG